MDELKKQIEQHRKRLDVLLIEQRKVRQTIKLLESELDAIERSREDAT